VGGTTLGFDTTGVDVVRIRNTVRSPRVDVRGLSGAGGEPVRDGSRGSTTGPELARRLPRSRCGRRLRPLAPTEPDEDEHRTEPDEDDSERE